MTNKEFVCQFIETIFNRKELTKLDEYMDKNYLHHDTDAAQGKAGFIDFIGHFFMLYPYVKLNIKHAYQENDIVVLHIHAVCEPGKTESNNFEVFRIENGLISEHWCSIQKLTDKQISNSSSIF